MTYGNCCLQSIIFWWNFSTLNQKNLNDMIAFFINTIISLYHLIFLTWKAYHNCRRHKPNLAINFSQTKTQIDSHWMKNVRIRYFRGPYFAALGFNTERCWVTRKTLNTGTFHAVSRSFQKILALMKKHPSWQNNGFHR